jgi:hypothetical protein
MSGAAAQDPPGRKNTKLRGTIITRKNYPSLPSPNQKTVIRGGICLRNLSKI